MAIRFLTICFSSLIIPLIAMDNQSLIKLNYSRPVNIDPFYVPTPFCATEIPRFYISPKVSSLKKLCIAVLVDKLIHRDATNLNQTHFANEQVIKAIEDGKFYHGLHDECRAFIKERYLPFLLHHLHKPGQNTFLNHRKIFTDMNNDSIAGFAFDTTHRYLFAVSRRAILWDLKPDEAEIKRFELEQDPSLRPGHTVVGFTENGLHVYAFLEGKFIKWDLKTGCITKKATIVSDPTFHGVALTADKKYLVGTHGRKVYLFPLGDFFSRIEASGEKEISFYCSSLCIAEHEGPIGNGCSPQSPDDSRRFERGGVEVLVLSPFDDYVLTGSPTYTISVYDIRNNVVKRDLTLFDQQGVVNSAAFCPNGRHVLLGTSSGNIYVWDLEDGLVTLFLKFSFPQPLGSLEIRDIQIHPSSPYIIFVRYLHVYLYDILNKFLLPLNEDGVATLFSPDTQGFFITTLGNILEDRECGILIPTIQENIPLSELLKSAKQ